MMQVYWHNLKGEQVREHKLRLNKAASVNELLIKIAEAEPEAKDKHLRLLETSDTKIFKVTTHKYTHLRNLCMSWWGVLQTIKSC